ncbi:MAG TPA: TSUP family transporter, partial [Xanthobacteraceae bacterium]
LAYAATAFRARRSKIHRTREKWFGPVVGAGTGLVTAATGVFVIPAVPYLEAIEMEKEEFIQALGLSFTVSTIALAVNLFLAGALAVAVAGPTLVALAAAGAGMGVVQVLRLRLSPAIFRQCFFVGLLLIGLYLIISALL